MNRSNLLLLEIDALLYDVGHFINAVDHDKHGYYLLNAHPLIGLSPREQNIVANLVRYHRQQFPSTDHDNFKTLHPNKGSTDRHQAFCAFTTCRFTGYQPHGKRDRCEFEEGQICMEAQDLWQAGSSACGLGIP